MIRGEDPGRVPRTCETQGPLAATTDGVTVSTSSNAKVGAGVAAVLTFIGVAVPALANALDPTLLLNGLVAIGIGAVTGLGQRRLARRHQRSALEGALRLWPPRRLKDTGLAPLGVHPPNEPSAYIERPNDEDKRVHEAVGGSHTVVIHGEEGVGKSRAAREAAREVCGEHVAFVPLNAEALRLIADRSVEMNLPKKPVCLWLDSVERFIEALDMRALHSLRQLTPEGVKIVATLRTEDWKKLLGGESGKQREAARALEEQATVIKLDPR